MIAFERVSKTYPSGQVALQDVSFHLPAGRLAFLTGPSGSGKSSLLRLIPQIDRPSSGKVLINGTDIGRVGAWRIPRLRRHIGVIFQNPHLLNEWSVFDNIALPLRV
ncbi:MAG: ATP-binding cassette domain-containing protein, partial [Halothiobacillaceae bacterium]|nr:ATP-binding cassette domain-containing protein [Halothiobacillaceae bacterium]